ncbi:MAG TPA: YdeI/OmpD-associated family protein [Flavihumibacter sp.]|nr:YdeI/OmpD-associated family protein [Flavihumibacter sp.]
MTRFKATIEKFQQQGEKSGWTYIRIPAAVAGKIKKDQKTSFRVKGKIGDLAITAVALLPMGGGDFIIALNAGMRRQIRQPVGAVVSVQLEEDEAGYLMNQELMDCLADAPEASLFFETLGGSHQRYFSKWVDDAKTEATRTKRIALILNALEKGWSYSEMIRAQAAKNRNGQ